MSSPSSTSPMIVSVRDLPVEQRFEASRELIRDALAGLPMREALERGSDAVPGEVAADLDIYTEDENVFVRGPLRGWIEVACSRCLGPARVALDEELAVTYLPKARLPQTEDEEGTDSEPPRGSKRRAAAAAAAAASAAGAVEVDEKELGAELTDDDLDLYGYDGEEIDLTPLFRDQVVLAVPFAPLCSEDCKGLCPQCGIDRNLETCDCKPPVDPRWAALQQHLKT